MTQNPENQDTDKFDGNWRDAPLPEKYCGVWRRLSITFPDGSVDDMTTVLWIQSPAHHIDLRIPADRPDMSSANGLDDLDATQLAALAAQEGFAGFNQFAPDLIAWRREMDFHPPEGPPDEGWMKEIEPDLFEEVGLHIPYTEIWQRIAPATGPFATVFGEQRMILRCGDWIAQIEDARPAMPPPGQLPKLVAEAAARGDRQAIRDLLDCEISFGCVRPDGTAVIEYSSHPWREGEQLPII